MSSTDEKQKRRVRKIFKKWFECLGLGWWHVDLVYSDDRDEFKSETEGYEVIAHTSGRWEYRTATITFNMALVPDRTDKELETDTLHEMVHILVFEAQGEDGEDYQKHVERVVCSLENAFQWTREAGHEEGARATRKEMKANG